MTRTVVHVISGLGVGGAERMLIRLLGSPRPAGMEHRVISLRAGGELRAEVEAVAGPVEEIGVVGPIPGPIAAWRLRTAVDRCDPALLMGWMYHGNLAASFAARGRPVVWNIRHAVYDLRRERIGTALAIRAGAQLSGRTDAVVYNSGLAAGQHEALGYARALTQVIPNGFDLERWSSDRGARLRARAMLGMGPATVVVGLVARVHPLKGHQHFMEAADRVARRVAGTGIDVQFVLMGTGTKEYLARWQRTRPGATAVMQALGERRDLPAIVPGMDIAVSSSISEAFPNAIGEAMSCGVPCVVTDVGDSAELLGGGGIVVPPGSADALAVGVLSLAQLPEASRRALGTVARQRIEEHFALRAIVQRYNELFDRTARGPG